MSRKEIHLFFEDYFSLELGEKFDENLKIKDAKSLDSLEIVNITISFEEKFGVKIKMSHFDKDALFKDVIDNILKSLS